MARERSPEENRSEDYRPEYDDTEENPFVPDDYDEMQAAEAIEMLHGCSITELVRIRDYEKAHKARQSVLRAIEQHLNQ